MTRETSDKVYGFRHAARRSGHAPWKSTLLRPPMSKQTADRLTNRLLFWLCIACVVFAWYMFKAPVDLPDYEEYIESMMDNEYYSEETSPRRLNATTACIGGLTPVQHKDAQEVSKWAFVREYQCTTLKPPCPQATATGEPCLKKEYRGFIVVYIFGMGYMFLGLAIVCDEFFCAIFGRILNNIGNQRRCSRSHLHGCRWKYA